MIAHELNALDLLSFPVWIVLPHTEELVFANTAARELTQEQTFSRLRKGIFSTYAQNELRMYVADLHHHHDIVEILTVCRDGKEIALTCRLSVKTLSTQGDVIIFEGIETPTAQGLKASRSANYQRPTLLLFADIIGRLIVPGELRVSVVSAFLGAPVLIFLVRRKQRGGAV